MDKMKRPNIRFTIKGSQPEHKGNQEASSNFNQFIYVTKVDEENDERNARWNNGLAIEDARWIFPKGGTTRNSWSWNSESKTKN